MEFHNLIHTVGNDAYSYGILNDETLGGTDKEVGLAGNPLLSALGLDTLGDVHTVGPVP